MDRFNRPRGHARRRGRMRCSKNVVPAAPQQGKSVAVILARVSSCNVSKSVIVTASQAVFRDHTDFTVMVDYEAEHRSCRPHARASHLLADGISASLSNAERVSLGFHKFGALPTHSFYVTWRAVSCTRERWCRMWSTFRWPCAFCFAATRCHLKVHHVCDTSALVSPALAVSHAAPALGWEYIPPATAVCAPPAPDVECFSSYSNLRSAQRRHSYITQLQVRSTGDDCHKCRFEQGWHPRRAPAAPGWLRCISAVRCTSPHMAWSPLPW